mmetsp:Transcript_129040/g.251284  ORF Transcript_129040/g.251284 Transcript_129040/m.251284 type:complete len:119 (+) Transcript_129040:1117-1473(+)
MPTLLLLAAQGGAWALSGNPAWVARQQPPLSRGQQRATVRGLHRMMIQWVSSQAPVPNGGVVAMAYGVAPSRAIEAIVQALYPPAGSKDQAAKGRSNLQAMLHETQRHTEFQVAGGNS